MWPELFGIGPLTPSPSAPRAAGFFVSPGGRIGYPSRPSGLFHFTSHRSCGRRFQRCVSDWLSRHSPTGTDRNTYPRCIFSIRVYSCEQAVRKGQSCKPRNRGRAWRALASGVSLTAWVNSGVMANCGVGADEAPYSVDVKTTALTLNGIKMTPHSVRLVHPSTHPLRVLVVDDDRDCADSLADLLGTCRVWHPQCYSGGKALAEAEDFRPDVCVLDLWMPGTDGWELACRLRAWTGDRLLLLIALERTGRATERRQVDGCRFRSPHPETG